MAYVFLTMVVAAAETESPSRAQVEFFESKIQPILSDHCYACHASGPKSAAGLQLDSREAILKGGRSGPAVVPADPQASLLLQRILSSDPKARMPLGEDQPLDPKGIADLKTWIQQGALWPERNTGAQPATAKPKSAVYPRPATPEQLAYFEKNVRPIFVNRCYNCHSDAFKEAGGLRVDVGISIFAGGDEGPVIIPGHPEKSILIQRLKSQNPKKRMPQESTEPLAEKEISTLEAWIKDGAAWPDETEKLPPTPSRIQAAYKELRVKLWSLQPLTNPAVPAVANGSWSSDAMDRFVLAKLEEKKLAPVADADDVTLIRRLSYDLTGLPPDPVDVKAFRKNHSIRAYRELVDRLLASPQFGERWGRHWLDVARYAESSGPSRNMPYPNAWRYRDYVIDALNRDIPYNRFIEEQLAGDLLPSDTPAEHDRLLTATGFLALGPKDVNQRFKARFKMDNIDDQIDTVTRSTMALTVSCARCHDHKFDPIPTTDYYALASIFASTQDAAGLTSRMGGSSLQYYAPKLLAYLSTAAQAPPVPSAEIEKLKAETEKAKAAVDAIPKPVEGAPPLSREERKKQTELRMRYQHLSEDLKLIDDLGERGYGVQSVREGVIQDTTVRIRGVEERSGPVVPRGLLTLISLPNTPKIPENHSGRLELAEWITDPQNPLTARVYVNRVWQHLFGSGIVSTVDNFGSTGAPPANAALLDYLAQEFIREGWSTKKLIREIVLTRVYRLGSEIPAAYSDIDPADQFVWRHAPRRMESEEIRDSILASSGALDRTHPSGSPAMALRMIEVRDDGPAVQSILAAGDKSRYRSIYLPLLRDETPAALAAYDPVAQTLVTGKRDETTVPSQALFMLNSPFVRKQALLFADALLSNKSLDDAKRFREIYTRVLGREPEPREIARARTFLARYAETWSHGQHGRQELKAIAAPVLPPEGDMWAGIQRSDNLNQDDNADEIHKAGSEDGTTPRSAPEAAWAAFIQALFGSAEFQFIR
jgi:hypothetical protein